MQPKELTVKEKQEIILEIMKDVDRFCREHNIRYSLSSGTLLGAVRHKGFIPWDDDADLFMLRQDFDRFVKIYKSNKYRLRFNTGTGENFFAAGYAKISDPQTVTADSTMMKFDGVFLDIFPLDHMPEDEKARKDRMHSVLSTCNRIYHRQRKDLVSIIKSYRHSLTWWMRKLDRIVHDPAYSRCRLVAHVVGSRNYRTVIDSNRFDTLVDTWFEGYPFLGFKDTDSYLTMVYGADYMTPRVWSHNTKVYRR